MSYWVLSLGGFELSIWQKWGFDKELGWHQCTKHITLSDTHKKSEIISKLISYIVDKRTATISESINLYHEDTHRHILEEYSKEQVRLAREALDYSKKAANDAAEAKEKADVLLDRVDYAIRKAEEAMEKADSAYNRADSAYYEANNSYR